MADDKKRPKKKAGSKPAAKQGGGAIKDMESYLQGAQHGAQIIMHKLQTQMSGGLQGLAGGAEGAAKGVGDTYGQLGQAMGGDNGLIPVNKIMQGAKTGIDSTP